MLCMALMVWNSLPNDLRTQKDFGSFKQGLKTWLFSTLCLKKRPTIKLSVTLSNLN